MAEPATPTPFSAEQAGGWAGAPADEIGGEQVGLVQGLFVDAESGAPSWLVVRQGRLRGTLVAVPASLCAGGGGRVWIGLEGEPIRTAPVVDPARPLLREHELTICGHYGIGEDLGRAAEVAGRAEGTVTSRPR
jgi:hypothetical protein